MLYNLIISSTASSSTLDTMRLSKGEIAAIAAASSLAFIVLLGLCALLYCCYRRRQKTKALRQKLLENPRLSIRPPTRISWGVDNLGATHAVTAQRWSAPGGTLLGYDQPAPAYDSNIVEVPRGDPEDVDLESDSGIGHGIKKKEFFIDLPILESEPKREPTFSPISRSRTLTRLSGWFTSSSSSSQSTERRPTGTAVSAPTPVRLQSPLTIVTLGQLDEEQKATNEDGSRKEAYLDLQVSRTSPFQIDFEKHGRERTQEITEQVRDFAISLRILIAYSSL